MIERFSKVNAKAASAKEVANEAEELRDNMHLMEYDELYNKLDTIQKNAKALEATDFQRLCRANALKAIQHLDSAITDSKVTSSSIRAAELILQYGYGKPTESIKLDAVVAVASPSDIIREIEARRNKLNNEYIDAEEVD